METVKKALEIGDHYRDNKHEKEALQSYIKAFKTIRTLCKERDVVSQEMYHFHTVALFRICDIIKIVNKDDNLLKCYKTLLLIQANHILDNMIGCERIGDIYFKLGDYQEALNWYERENAFAFYEEDLNFKNEHAFRRATIVSHERIGQCLFQLRRYDEALDNFNIAYDYANTAIREGYSFLMEVACLMKNKTQTQKLIDWHNKKFRPQEMGSEEM